MAARKKITEVAITTTEQYNGNLSNHCPYVSGTTDMNNWFEHFLNEFFRAQGGGDIKMFVNVAFTDYILIDKGLITSVTITLS